MMKFNRNTLFIAALAALAVMMPDVAHAGGAVQVGQAATSQSQDLASTIGSLQSQTASVPNAVAWFCYIIGTGFCAFGIMKLKAHADNAAQNKLGPALGVLLTGAAFLAFPGLAAAVVKSGGYSGAATQYQTQGFQ